MRAATSSSDVTTIPPSPTGRFLFEKKLKQPTPPREPSGWPSHVAPGACAASSITATPLAASRVEHRAHVAGVTRVMKDDDRLRPRSDRGFEIGRIEVQVVLAQDVAEHRHRADANHGVRSRHEVERREDHLVARSAADGEQRQVQGGRPVRHGERMSGADGLPNRSSSSATRGPMLHQPEAIASRPASSNSSSTWMSDSGTLHVSSTLIRSGLRSGGRMNPQYTASDERQRGEGSVQVAVDHLGVRAIILAGGRGTRLQPYTSVLPKPLMPIGDRAIIEITVDRLIESGVSEITLCVGYLAHLIEAVFTSRQRIARLDYVHEREPLGTAGPLRLVPGLDGTFLVMNGDLLTDLDFRALVDLHRRAGNMITIATHERRNKIDYGVLHVGEGESPRLVRYDEKPETTLTVSMGIYVLEPEALEHIPADGYFDFPHLVQALLDRDLPVGTYPFAGSWLDIGRRDDYEKAMEHWESTNISAGAGAA